MKVSVYAEPWSNHKTSRLSWNAGRRFKLSFNTKGCNELVFSKKTKMSAYPESFQLKFTPTTWTSIDWGDPGIPVTVSCDRGNYPPAVSYLRTNTARGNCQTQSFLGKLGKIQPAKILRIVACSTCAAKCTARWNSRIPMNPLLALEGASARTELAKLRQPLAGNWQPEKPLSSGKKLTDL